MNQIAERYAICKRKLWSSQLELMIASRSQRYASGFFKSRQDSFKSCCKGLYCQVNFTFAVNFYKSWSTSGWTFTLSLCHVKFTAFKPPTFRLLSIALFTCTLHPSTVLWNTVRWQYCPVILTPRSRDKHHGSLRAANGCTFPLIVLSTTPCRLRQHLRRSHWTLCWQICVTSDTEKSSREIHPGSF